MKLDAPRFGDARGLYAQVTGTRHFHLGIFDGDALSDEPLVRRSVKGKDFWERA